MLSDLFLPLLLVLSILFCSLILFLVYLYRLLEKYKVNQVSVCTSAFKTHLFFPFVSSSWGYGFLSQANQYLGATLIPLAIVLTFSSNSMWKLECPWNYLADHIGYSWNLTNIFF